MSRVFAIQELLRVAVSDEQGGQALYREMAGRALDVRLRQRFLRLAEEEAFHARKFEQVLARLEAETPPPAGREDLRPLEDLAAESLAGGDAQLVERAIRFERAQLELQQEMSGSIRQSYRPVIDMVIREERDHLALLARELERLQA
jgi:rubrerythrin